MVSVRSPGRGDTFFLAPIEDQESRTAPTGVLPQPGCRPDRGAAPTGVPPLPGLYLVVGIRTAVDTAGDEPFAAPRLHHKTRIPPSADLQPISGCTAHQPATVGRVRDAFCGPEVGQVVLPALPGGSPASLDRQVNAPLTRSNDLPYLPLTRSNDLPYVFRVRRLCHGPPLAHAAGTS